MESIFTLPFPEYSAIWELSKYFKKNDGYSCFIPVSRQHAHVDFILVNAKSPKHVTFQVKSSRHWTWNNVMEGENVTWNGFHFNNFLEKCKPGLADYYLLLGVYPKFLQTSKVSAKHEHWSSTILCFSASEMMNTLKKVKLKGDETKSDRFFGFSIGTNGEIRGNRGFKDWPIWNQYLLESKIPDIKKDIDEPLHMAIRTEMDPQPCQATL